MFLSLPLSRAFPLLTSLGLWDPVCDTDLSVFPGWSQRGAVHEEDLLQTAAALLHSPGHWHALLQRPLSAHSRGSILYSRWCRLTDCCQEKTLNIHFDGAFYITPNKKQKLYMSVRNEEKRLMKAAINTFFCCIQSADFSTCFYFEKFLTFCYVFTRVPNFLNHLEENHFMSS